jgi:hypothetical protein
MSFNASELRYAMHATECYVTFSVTFVYLCTFSQCYQNHHVLCNALIFNMAQVLLADSDPGSLKNPGDPDTELGL